ncbi:FtsW/RodA/SpoVE family cell cycle protein [Thalassobacillus pellis]|uniref:FtsW/RodA/SpoVE family cell cycle protein n=1 Tax=Thalassobacillus pellis TaxID=748008 RepID=UPI0019608CB5|nr:FtsW/RodA/SpoVE family cell cycle protein [Thalassobacillus pellis]MBM7552895.1 cell division protein FtsW [Thalassobacillus pellis]
MRQKFKSFDFTLMFTPIILCAFGVVMIYSASMVYGPVVLGVSSDYFMKKQMIWAALGILLMLFFAVFPYRHLQRLTKLIVLVMILSLAGLFVFGNEVNNSLSWYNLGFMSLQPAEIVKVGIIIYLSSVYAKKQRYIDQFGKAVVPPLVLTSLILGLIVLQPDLGTAAIIGLIASFVIASSGIKGKHIGLLVGVTLAFVLLIAPQMVTDERLARFTGAYQPFETPEGDGYHLIQSYVAIGTGGILGEGLGQGVQKLGYLPEPHTDFIMAVIAEELGFIGVLIVVGSLSTIVLRGLYISRKCKDTFGALLALGISSMIAIQSFINLGAMSGMLPITGVPLPFVSYGGSSLLIMMLSVGILNNIARKVKAKEDQETQDEQQPPQENQTSFQRKQLERQGVKS